MMGLRSLQSENMLLNLRGEKDVMGDKGHAEILLLCAPHKCRVPSFDIICKQRA